MTATCTTPIAEERLVAYWANELPAAEVDAIDEHLFACDTCSAASAALATIVAVFRSMIPPVISADQVAAYAAAGQRIRANEFEPGVRKTVRFDHDTDLLIHHLRGLDLADAVRVAVTVRSETGPVLLEDPFAPFNRERGEVLIACQRHFSAMPRDVAFDVRVHRASGVPPTVSTYFIPHVFPS